MATNLQAGPQGNFEISENIKKKKIGIVVAEWNKDITDTLRQGCEDALKKAGIENIITQWIPGSFELPLAAQYMIECGHAEAVICIGCLIKGETPHFHYISESVSLTISQLAIKYMRPVIFGVLTVDTLEQAQARAGGNLGNKGEEAGMAALQMLSVREAITIDTGKSKIGFGSK